MQRTFAFTQRLISNSLGVSLMATFTAAMLTTVGLLIFLKLMQYIPDTYQRDLKCYVWTDEECAIEKVRAMKKEAAAQAVSHKAAVASIEAERQRLQSQLDGIKQIEDGFFGLNMFKSVALPGTRWSVTTGLSYSSMLTAEYTNGWCHIQGKQQKGVNERLDLSTHTAKGGVRIVRVTAHAKRTFGLSDAKIEEARRLCSYPGRR